MRRCKYFIRDIPDFPHGICTFGNLYGFKYWTPSQCLNGGYCYTPVELDPYWKDIFDETNRRLNNG